MPEEMQAKAALICRISRIIEKHRLNEKDVADILGLRLAEISAIVRGRLSEFFMTG